MGAVRDLAGGVESPHLADLVTLFGVTTTLERMATDPGFPSLRPSFVDPRRFRHDVITLGFVDHLRRNTPYVVRLPSDARAEGRSYDFDLENPRQARVEFETKAPSEFEGPTRLVSIENAQKALEKSWQKAVGRKKQLTGENAGALLVGGVTMNLQSLLAIQRAALSLLERRGSSHPNFWGFAAFTMVVLRDNPKTETVSGAPEGVRELVSWVETAWARNPSYRGHVEIVPVPSNFA